MKRLLEPLLDAMIVLGFLALLLVPYRHGHFAQVADTALGISDFGAFYCGALVLREGKDPYLLAPLKACEIERVYGPSGTNYRQHGGIDPAPQPPYTLALYEPFTFLSYRVAGLLWLALLAVCTFAAAAGLRKLTRLPFWIVLSFLAAVANVSFTYGQTQPLLTLSLVAAALLLRSGKPSWAVAALAPTLIDPHVGAAPLLALLLWLPRARAAVAILVVAVAGFSLAVGGLALNLEYFGRAIPAQAFSEITAPFQYSLTALLSMLGVPDALALKLGALQYAAMLSAGTLGAGLLARRIGTPAFVLFPAACAVLGGPYIHVTQSANAIPFALYFATQVPERAAWAWAGAALAALVWPLQTKLLSPFVAAIAYATANGIAPKASPALRALVATGLFALYFASGVALQRVPATPLHRLDGPAAVAAAGYDPALASTQEAVEVRSWARFTPTISSLVARVPTWAGLIAIIATGLASFKKPPRAEESLKTL